MKIEILGMGCQKCNQLAETAKAAAAELGITCKKDSSCAKLLSF